MGSTCRWYISYPDSRENSCTWFSIKLHICHPYWFVVGGYQWQFGKYLNKLRIEKVKKLQQNLHDIYIYIL